MKKFLSLLIVLMLFSSTSVSIISEAATMNFSDLPENHWAYSYVEYMVENNIVSGYPDGTFRPNEAFSRAAFATLLYKTFELEPTTSPVDFVDLPSDHWAYTYIQSSLTYLTYFEYESGIYFEPNEYSVREDVAVAMVIAAGVDEIMTPDLSYLDDFTDADDISPELKEYVALAVEVGIMKGSGTEFNPQKALTRAEACTVFAKYAMDIADQLAEEKAAQPIKKVVGAKSDDSADTSIDTSDNNTELPKAVTEDAKTDTEDAAIITSSEPDGGYYRFKESIVTKTGAYWNTDTEWKKATDIKDGEVVMNLYDPDFDRGHTSGQGFDITAVAKWTNLPEYIIPNETYNIGLQLDLTHNHNPEKAFVEFTLSGYKVTLNDENTLISGLFLKDANGTNFISAGEPDDPDSVGGSLNLIYEAPGPASTDNIGIKFMSNEVFEYLYIYEWVE